MKRTKIFLTIFFSAVAVILILTINALLEKPLDTKNQESSAGDFKIEMPNVPDELEFCGEKVPMNDIEVKERVEREIIVNSYWYSSTVQMLKKSTRWFPVIEPILKANGIPDDFKYLCAAESNLNNSTSLAGAVGFWQFLETTAKQYGLEITKEVDERYNVEKSTEAACKYLNKAYKKYGSWTMAAASFNIGFENLDNQIKRQKANNYYDLVLNSETSRYIFRVLALKTIILDPEVYGYHLKPEDYYKPIPTKEDKVTRTIDDLADYAKAKGINYKYLKYFNPWLRENYLPVKEGQEYFIKIPKSGTININSN